MGEKDAQKMRWEEFLGYALKPFKEDEEEKKRVRKYEWTRIRVSAVEDPKEYHCRYYLLQKRREKRKKEN